MQSLFIRAWNWVIGFRERRKKEAGVKIGRLVVDGSLTNRPAIVPNAQRAQHIAILGKTGTGKSSLIRSLIAQDIKAGRGFAVFDIHGDLTPFVLQAIEQEEKDSERDLSGRVIVADPSNTERSIGLNVLSGAGDRFTRIAELTDILRRRFQLDAFGARTEELLRNSLLVLAANNLTLLELTPFLTQSTFRALCLKRETNAEVKEYFTDRFERLSPGGKRMYSEAVLNKVSAFTVDPRFRHIVGQVRSSFDFAASMDSGKWIVINLDKGSLGLEAVTLGSLFLTQIKSALFVRQRRSLFTLYCDEVQNLIAYESGLETLLSEARKYAVSVCSASQYLEQYPKEVKAAIMAIGSHIYFQVSGDDAAYLSRVMLQGASVTNRLVNLPQRRFLYKTLGNDLKEAEAQDVPQLGTIGKGLYERSQKRSSEKREEIERSITKRRLGVPKGSDELLHNWT
jgi:hypothetical protein